MLRRVNYSHCTRGFILHRLFLSWICDACKAVISLSTEKNDGKMSYPFCHAEYRYVTRSHHKKGWPMKKLCRYMLAVSQFTSHTIKLLLSVPPAWNILQLVNDNIICCYRRKWLFNHKPTTVTTVSYPNSSVLFSLAFCFSHHKHSILGLTITKIGTQTVQIDHVSCTGNSVVPRYIWKDSIVSN